jgi:hypothetical protein
MSREEKIDFSSLEAIVLGPEDTLILRMPTFVSREHAEYVNARLKLELPHLKVLLLSKDSEAAILRQEDK